PPLFSGRVFGRDPRRGDVIVFRLPREPDVPYIKRLIGLPGDTIQVIKGQVFVNGKPNARRFTGWTRDHDDPGRIVPKVVETNIDGRKYLTFGGSAGGEGDNTDPYVVPAGHYFFMGDNRDNSLDSRWPEEIGVGFVPAENVVGRAEWVLLSWKQGASVFKPWTWLNLDPQRFFLRVK
ncbi:MAG: signal peptidase I, partial [Proteobacteria bacterium]|nr:signal peptidase I [Pseudomonadota bacterium]